MKTIILTDRVKYQDEIRSVRNDWLSDLLIFLGIDEEKVSKMPRDVAVEYFFIKNLDIIEYPDIGALKVVYEGEVVGEWAGPEFTMKEDDSGRLYYETEIEHWSIIDEEIDS